MLVVIAQQSCQKQSESIHGYAPFPTCEACSCSSCNSCISIIKLSRLSQFVHESLPVCPSRLVATDRFAHLEWLQQIAHSERSRSSRISRSQQIAHSERSRSSRISNDLNRSRIPSARAVRASRVIATDLDPVHLVHLEFERLSRILISPL